MRTGISIICVMVVFQSVPSLIAQSVHTGVASRYTPTLILDPNQLHDSDLSQVVIALTRAKRAAWHSVAIHGSLYSTLAREYSYADGGPFAKTALALTREVAEVNHVSDPNSIQEGTR